MLAAVSFVSLVAIFGEYRMQLCLLLNLRPMQYSQTRCVISFHVGAEWLNLPFSAATPTLYQSCKVVR